MFKLLTLALITNLGAMSVAAAQPAAKTPDDFSAIGAGQTITVFTDTGAQTTGRLLRFTPESLAIAVDDVETTFERRSVSSVVEHGDSLGNGMKVGAIAGGGFGLFIGIGLASWTSCGYGGCDVGEGSAVAMIPTAIFGLIGLGMGAGIDALNTGQRRLYDGTPATRMNGGAEDFSGLAAKREIVVVDNLGRETRGRLLALTPDTVALRVGNMDQTVRQQDVQMVFERGDSVKNGTAIGLLTGAAVGLTTGASKTTCGRDPLGIGLITAFSRYEPCTFNERVGQALGEGALLGLLGAGLGAAVDAIIPGRRLLYERPQARSTHISVVPSLGPSRSGLSMAVSW